MPAGGRFAACLAVSLLAHGAFLLVWLPSRPVLQVAVAPLQVVLRPPESGAVAPLGMPERRAVVAARKGGGAIAATPVSKLRQPQQVPPTPAAKALPDAPNGPGNGLPSSAPLPVVDASPAEALSLWRPAGGAEPMLQAAQALSQEAAGWRWQAQLRAMVIGAMWMDMYQRLSVEHPQHEGDCLVQRATGFRPECQGQLLGEWSERLHLQEWALRLAELDESLQVLRLMASQGRLQLQVLTPGEFAPAESAAHQAEQQGVQR